MALKKLMADRPMKTYAESVCRDTASVPHAEKASAPSKTESVRFRSLGDELVGKLFRPAAGTPAPTLIVCHGAGEFKENYFEMCEVLAGRGVASLALDMHGHGESGGERYFLKIKDWVADIRAAIGFFQPIQELIPTRSPRSAFLPAARRSWKPGFWNRGLRR